MKLHHIGIFVEDIEDGIQRYKAMFGFVSVTEVVDDPVQNVSVVLLPGPEANSIPVELIAPRARNHPAGSHGWRGLDCSCGFSCEQRLPAYTIVAGNPARAIKKLSKPRKEIGKQTIICFRENENVTLGYLGTSFIA